MGGIAALPHISHIGLALALLAAVGCSSIPDHGIVHTVRPGENVYRIARYYGVTQNDVVRANDIGDVTSIAIGQELFIPGASKTAPPKTLAVAFAPTAPSGDFRARAKREANLSFGWPLQGWVSSRYGQRRGRPHEGIDIPAKSGTAIRASESGRVIHSGKGLGAYGRVVIIKHAGRYSTVYAHNRKNRVKKGQFVEKGQVIAEVGSSGNASGPHLHFEVRRDRSPKDPMLFLPRGGS